MWKMWGVLSLPGAGIIAEPKIYGIYTSLNQAIKAIRGNDSSFEYTYTEEEDRLIMVGIAKTDPSIQIKYIIKEYKIDV